MTGKDLLTAMSGIDGRYIEEAAPAAAPKTRSLRRPLLVAAAIAAALLLDGDYPVLSSYLGSIRRYLHEAEGQNGREAAVCAQS